MNMSGLWLCFASVLSGAVHCAVIYCHVTAVGYGTLYGMGALKFVCEMNEQARFSDWFFISKPERSTR